MLGFTGAAIALAQSVTLTGPLAFAGRWLRTHGRALAGPLLGSKLHQIFVGTKIPSNQLGVGDELFKVVDKSDLVEHVGM